MATPQCFQAARFLGVPGNTQPHQPRPRAPAGEPARAQWAAAAEPGPSPHLTLFLRPFSQQMGEGLARGPLAGLGNHPRPSPTATWSHRGPGTRPSLAWLDPHLRDSTVHLALPLTAWQSIRSPAGFSQLVHRGTLSA